MTELQIGYTTKMSGHFTINKYRRDGNGKAVLVSVHDFDNLITNNGLDRWCAIRSRATAVSSCQVGTGSTAPSVTDTALASFLAIQPTMFQSAKDRVADYWRLRYVWQFAQGAAAGTLTEVGIGTTGSAGSLFSRALILDGSGNPTTLTILPTEFLTITYELRLYVPLADLAPVVTSIGGVSTTVTGRAASSNDADLWAQGAMIHYTDVGSNFLGVQVYSGPIGPDNTSSNQGSGSSPDERIFSTYVPGTFYTDITGIFGINQGNFGAGGVQSLSSRTQSGAFQFGFSPAIAKDNTKQLTLVTRHSIARYTP